jgi:hypothetical protein
VLVEGFLVFEVLATRLACECFGFLYNNPRLVDHFFFLLLVNGHSDWLEVSQPALDIVSVKF